MKRIFAAFSVAVSLALFSCGTTRNIESPAATDGGKTLFEGRKKALGDWHLVSMSAGGVPVAVLPVSMSVFGDGDALKLSGSTGANTFDGRLRLNSRGEVCENPSFDATQKETSAEMEAFEDEFLRIISFATRVETGDSFVIVDQQSESRLVFRRGSR